MWAAVCRDCMWASGEAYLRSVADYMATVHAQDHSGHKVTVGQVGKPTKAAENNAGRPEASRPSRQAAF